MRLRRLCLWRLLEYDAVAYVVADAVLLRPLDSLFELVMAASIATDEDDDEDGGGGEEGERFVVAASIAGGGSGGGGQVGVGVDRHGDDHETFRHGSRRGKSSSYFQGGLL